MFVNFLDYKLTLRLRSASTPSEAEGLKSAYGRLVEIRRFFPSSKTCSCCGHVLDELTLDIREWDCPKCNTHHDRDGNAALNIRNEGIRILSMDGGNPVLAVSRQRKTNKPQRGKAVVVETGSPHPICTQMGVG
jgi:putative transposase